MSGKVTGNGDGKEYRTMREVATTDDLSGLPLDKLAAKANTAHLQVEEGVRYALVHARRAGELLAAAKRQLKHGEWLPWIEQNCQFSERTAQTYLRVHREWGRITAKAQDTADLTLSHAIELLTDRRAEAPPAEKAAPEQHPAARNGREPGTRGAGPDKAPDSEPHDEPACHETPPGDGPAAAAPEPALDALGRPVPPALAPAFAARETFREARLLVRRLNVLLTAIATSPGGAHLARDLSRREDQGRVYYRSRALEDFDAALKFHEPHSALCPWCEQEHSGRTDRACKACFGLGWVPFQLWKQAPAEYRAAAAAGANGRPAEDDGDVATEPELDTPVADEAGVELPARAVPAFAQLPELRTLCRTLDQAAREVERLGKAPVGAHAHWQSAQSQLRGARKTMWAGRPAHGCPCCRGEKDDCLACRGHGFVTAATYDQAKNAAGA
jgi:hypothetical protein